MDATSENPHKSQARYWILFAALLLLAVALILPPLINLNRYQRRIADAIGSALGRKVHLSSVTLQVLPRPGLTLSDFWVEEDPAFGAEPTLRAPSVNAYIRLTSLWRGRLEIGRISLDQPSLNLVRNGEGRWNIGTVLLQASRISNAPTGQRHAGNAPRFPYIEASNARVNFKNGAEKKPFSFVNADFSMWQENPNEWQLRLEAQPVRTDLDLGLADTGTLRVAGSLDRAADFDSMPVNLEAEWANAPLGQMSRLFLGRDTGWRGDLRVNATVKGTVYNPIFKTRLRVAGMHRQEFTPLDAFNVDATCQAAYRHAAHTLDGLTCLWPVDPGHLLLTSNAIDLANPQPSWNLQITNLPASFGLAGLRLLRQGFATSTQVAGVIGGHLAYDSQKNLTGEATVHGFVIRSTDADVSVTFSDLHLASAAIPVNTHNRRPIAAPASGLHLDAAQSDFGGSGPLTISGDLQPQGFSLRLNGNASLEKLMPLVSNLGIVHQAIGRIAAKGTANLDLLVHGPWNTAGVNDAANSNHFAVTEGTLRIENTTVQTAFLPDPVEIVSAQVSFFPDRISWNPVSIVFHKMPANLTVSAPFPCIQPGCVRDFSVTLPTLDAAALQSALIGGGEHGELLEQILSRLDRDRTQWPALNGTIHAGTFTLGKIALHDASASVRVEGRHVQFTSIDAHTLGGLLSATGSMDATENSPKYVFDVHLLRANAAETAAFWDKPALAGTISGNLHAASAGYSGNDLEKSSKGAFHWDWTQGSLPGGPPELLHFDHWVADGTIGSGGLILSDSQPARGQRISGTISFDRDVKLTVGAQ